VHPQHALLPAIIARAEYALQRMVYARRESGVRVSWPTGHIAGAFNISYGGNLQKATLRAGTLFALL